MFTPDKNGVAPYSHYESIQKQTGTTPPELEEYNSLSIPVGFYLYWQDFCALNLRRTNDGMGNPCPLSYSEIQAWANLSGVEVSSLQLDVICRLDNIWIREYVKSQKK